MTGDSPFGELRLDPLHLGVVNAEFAKFSKILENRWDFEKGDEA
jgi:hypothetical protein